MPPEKSDQASAKVSIPWTVKGIPSECRAAATKAAKHQRLTIGQWLTTAIAYYIASDGRGDVAISAGTSADGQEGQAVASRRDEILKMSKVLNQQFNENANCHFALQELINRLL